MGPFGPVTGYGAHLPAVVPPEMYGRILKAAVIERLGDRLILNEELQALIVVVPNR